MRLLLGVPYQGKRYFDVEARLLTLGRECAALEKIAELGLDSKEKLNKAEQMLVDLAYLSEQFKVIGIPKDKLTPQFLLNNLATDDYVLITEAIAELRKKHIADGDNPNPPNGE
ncbi:hypothetical protein BKG95_10180 [Rodentibacter pneumotropicus]|uniref:Mu-like prophage FluMu protein gp41 n=1 Tax=Rodentibacter pneumotropicus TaxID=758 RepID=A0AAW5LBV1_9PAST|nr:hypothetical protein [Rodentibacter pneumotropicus]MCQ9121199.1 hypothetical protein [Rodentibacter pneumotropicus]OOF66567.1 hypothetical protein BKG95_10180 [Rodentibacter pneumotropicus]